MRTTAWLAGLLLFGSSAAIAQDEAETRVFVNALAPQGQLLILGELARRGTQEFLYAEDPIDFAWDGPADARRATLYSPELGVTATVSGLALELDLRPDDNGLIVTLLPGEGGSNVLDLMHELADPAVEIVLEETTVTLGRGAVRIAQRAPGDWQIVATSGDAEVASGEDSRRLESVGENQIVVSGSGLQSPARADVSLDGMLASQQSLVQAALLPDLVRVAESVAEGDIEPPTRGSRVAAATVAPAIRVKEIVPRGGFGARVDNRAVAGVVAGGGQTLAEAFIGSGQAALAVVGARLQRTRVVGVSGIGGSALSINRELTLPFTLAPLRR